jgi:hypothetical protein
MSNSPKSTPLQALLDDRISFYRTIAERLEKQGPLAPMPELEPTVRYLQKELTDPEIIKYCEENSFAEASRQLVLNALWHTDLEFQVSPYTGGIHQHKPPAEGRFPYQSTLRAIDEALSFFDSYERSTKRGHDNHYQLDRYRYHSQTLPYLDNWFQLPTQDALTLKDLIVMRSVPVGVRMVAARTSFLDAYFNSPLNAAVHDDNHSRRLNSENERYFLREGITTPEQKMKVYEDFDNIIQNTIMPNIIVLPGMDEEEANIRKAMTILYFELLHEYAKTPDRETLKQELMFAPDGPSAFEVVMRQGETPEDLENRRLENKNLDSGAIFTRGQPGNTMYYFMDKGRNFLTSAYNKIHHGFFDNNREGFDEAPPIGARGADIFAKATQRIMADFNLTSAETGLDYAKIVSLLTNGSSEGEDLGKNLEKYPGHDLNDPLNNAPKVVTDHKQSDAHVQGFALG